MYQETLRLATPAPSLKSRQTTNGISDGIFGWYHFIQDFTGQFALKWLKELCKPGDIIWEPFSGSGTTLVAAKLLGYNSIGYDISPFMVDVARVKVDWSIDTSQIEQELHSVLNQLSTSKASEPAVGLRTTWDEYDHHLNTTKALYLSDKRLSKWIAPRVTVRVQELLKAVDGISNIQIKRFLRLAAASILIPASNMTFRPNICYERRPHIDYPVVQYFQERALDMISDYRSLKTNEYPASAQVDIGDARYIGPPKADLIFTSPPYPNDMEYVHQTRLELVLLEYINGTRELTELKKQMISSSVKLVYRSNEWQRKYGLEIPGVKDIYLPVKETLKGRNWGWNAAEMIAQYFGGMRIVFKNWAAILPPGATVAIVIGDSAFNGVKVPSDRLLAEAASMEGISLDSIDVFRTRWNTKHDIELRESVVILQKPRYQSLAL